MLTVTCEPKVNEATDKIDLSDREISRRVLQIRSTWSLAERLRRRREADRRLEELLDVLFAEAA